MIGIVSASSPEMDRLAGELCRRGVLDIFVRRYIQKGRWWETVLSSLLFHNATVAATFGRRSSAADLLPHKVVDAGIPSDFCAAVARRLRLGRCGIQIRSLAIRSRDRAISKQAVQSLRHSRTVVATHSIAGPVFETVKANGGRTILNYPIAHHRFSQRLLAEEKEREPSFASTIPNDAWEFASALDWECELADAILVGSSFVRDSFLQEGVGNKDIIVAPYGMNPSLFSPPATARTGGTFRALFVGQLTQRKGLSYLLKAYRMFQSAGTELAIAGPFSGDPAGLKEYQALFLYLGSLPASRLAQVYRDADVFVFPTLLEGMGLVVLEAMASGLPVITTNNGPGEIVRDGIDGYIVPIRDADSIADRLERLRANSELRHEMGRNARQRALEFTWKRYCDQAADAVLRVANGVTTLECVS